MDSSSFQKRFAFATNLIQEAGEIALGYFRRLDTLVVKSKGPQDMASQADLDTEIFIRDRLKSQFPEDAFLGEETGRTEIGETEGSWVVDPIDGTQPFIGGLGSWCVSIAYLADHILQMGFVYSPARKELFVGGLQQHATLNGTPIRVSSATDLTGGIVGVGYSPRVKPDDFLQVFSKLLQRGGMFYREGSGALTLCYVASGSLIGYIEQHINSWDCLGALAIIQAAPVPRRCIPPSNLSSSADHRVCRSWPTSNEVMRQIKTSTPKSKRTSSVPTSVGASRESIRPGRSWVVLHATICFRWG
jgi:myo-inositol-1(or 4)-monophosphatase